MSTTLFNPLTGGPISDQELKSLSELADAQLKLEGAIEKAETQLEDLKAQLAQVQQTLIPDLMLELGLKEVKLANGASVVVKPFVSAKIPEPLITDAFNWLREHNHDAIIKREIACNFGRGEDKRAERVAAMLRKGNILFSDKSTIHHATLKAFCAEQILADPNFPRDLFGVYEGKRAKITPAKE